MQLQENTLFDLRVKVSQMVAHFPVHHVICAPNTFEVGTFNGLGGDAFARKVTDGLMHAHTERKTDNGPTLIQNNIYYAQ